MKKVLFFLLFFSFSTFIYPFEIEKVFDIYGYKVTAQQTDSSLCIQTNETTDSQSQTVIFFVTGINAFFKWTELNEIPEDRWKEITFIVGKEKIIFSKEEIKRLKIVEQREQHEIVRNSFLNQRKKVITDE